MTAPVSALAVWPVEDPCCCCEATVVSKQCLLVNEKGHTDSGVKTRESEALEYIINSLVYWANQNLLVSKCLVTNDPFLLQGVIDF